MIHQLHFSHGFAYLWALKSAFANRCGCPAERNIDLDYGREYRPWWRSALSEVYVPIIHEQSFGERGDLKIMGPRVGSRQLLSDM
ncbi:hypothetical protein BGX38DRAFT_1152806 [Terfezia claveryi]|nr:hypothetical protein BGX38DRAFT_1152806 [Terfezia claveryi]